MSGCPRDISDTVSLGVPGSIITFTKPSTLAEHMFQELSLLWVQLLQYMCSLTSLAKRQSAHLTSQSLKVKECSVTFLAPTMAHMLCEAFVIPSSGCMDECMSETFAIEVLPEMGYSI